MPKRNSDRMPEGLMYVIHDHDVPGHDVELLGPDITDERLAELRQLFIDAWKKSQLTKTADN